MGLDMPPVLLSGQITRRLSRSTQSHWSVTISERRPANSNCRRIASGMTDRKSTRLNSSHLVISYAVFCLKKKNNLRDQRAEYTPFHPESDPAVSLAYDILSPSFAPH